MSAVMTQRGAAVAAVAAVAYVCACAAVSPSAARDGVPLLLAPARLLVPIFHHMAAAIDTLITAPVAAAEALATLPFQVAAYIFGATTTGQMLSAAGAACALLTAAPALGGAARLAVEFFSKIGLWAALRTLACELRFLGPACGFYLCFCMHVVTFVTPAEVAAAADAWPHTRVAFDFAAHVLAASQLAWSLRQVPGASKAATHLALAVFGASTFAASAAYHNSAHLGFAAMGCVWAAFIFGLEEWPVHITGNLAAPGPDAYHVSAFIASAAVALPFAVAGLLTPGPGDQLPAAFGPFMLGGRAFGSYAALLLGLWVSSMTRCKAVTAQRTDKASSPATPWLHSWGWYNIAYIACRFALAGANDVGARCFAVAFALLKAGELTQVMRGPMWVLALAGSVLLWAAGRYIDSHAA